MVNPTGNSAPEAGTQTTTGFVSQLSVAVELKLTTRPKMFVVLFVTLPGQVIIGGTVSTTFTV